MEAKEMAFSTQTTVWVKPLPSEARGWPARSQPCNLVARLTSGLNEAYASVRASRVQGRHLPPPIETSADGQLVLSLTMPLIAQRYRYLHTLSASDLSQLVSAVDTYRSCPPAVDGRRSPLVALKILNAQHWALGAQEYERMRQLWRDLSREGVEPSLAQARTHFEQGAHFCIVFDLLTPLSSLDCSANFPALGPAGGSAAVSMAAHTSAAGAATTFARPRPLVGTLTPAPPTAFGAASPFAPMLSNGAAAAGPSAAASGSAGSVRAPRPRLAIETLRLASAQLLGALASMHSRQLVHADLKPDNIMLEPPLPPGAGERAGASRALSAPGGSGLGGRVLLIDFSNAMGLHEAPAYHDDFEVQTLAYRAPEVVYGVPFGCAIDLWSFGVTLAELYSGRALLHAASRGGLAVELAGMLGQPPPRLFGAGKYAPQLLPLVAHTAEPLTLTLRRQRLSAVLSAPTDAPAQQLVDLLARLLTYDPAERLDAREALCHPFLAPTFPFRALLSAAPPPPPVAQAATQAAEAAGARTFKSETSNGGGRPAAPPSVAEALAEAPAAAKGAALTANGSPGGAARVPKRKFGLGTGIGIGSTPSPVISPRAPSRPRPAPGTMAVTSLERSLER
jgi:hypothetical protein